MTKAPEIIRSLRVACSLRLYAVYAALKIDLKLCHEYSQIGIMKTVGTCASTT